MPLLIIAQRTAQGPKAVKAPPQPMRRQSQPTMKVKPSPASKPSTAPKPHIRSQSQSTKKSPRPTAHGRSRIQSEKSPNPPPPLAAPKRQKAKSLPKQPEQQQISLQPSEQPQNSSSLEYITLREMSAELVDLLAGNAPVIAQLNNHLFSSGLIPNAVHITVGTTGLTPYDRADKMINAELATLECHPHPNSAFTSLITALHKVGLATIATKLMEILGKCIHH